MRAALTGALLAAAAVARAAGVVELPSVPAAASLAGPAAAVAAPVLPAAAPSLSAPAAPTLSASPAAASAPAAAPDAGAPAAGAPARFDFVVRRGVDAFGRTVLLVDALDASAPARGTIGHVDVSYRDDQASLDEPLDSSVDAALRPEGAPAGADLTHFREHLWFGLSVLPAYRRAGLASRLLDDVEGRLRAAGVRLLFIRATESSVDFYRRRYGARVRIDEAVPDRDGGTEYRLEVDLGAR